MGDKLTHKPDEVVVFLHEVRREGLLSDFLADTLLDYRSRQARPAGPQQQVHPAFAPQPPMPAREQTSSPPAVPAATVAPQPAPAFVPAPPRRRNRAEIWARYARKRSKKMWGTLSADFAANALTYLGVLLSVVVIFVFFSFGYFAEFINADHKQYRPLAEAGVVAFFLGLAWVLRHRTGIPQTSAAIEMIGIILVPVMMSASFRDGCTPSYRPWCLPPDVDGPARWAAYGVVALISTAIYYLYARRRAIYSYLIGPMLWVAVGAFALYLDDGIRLVRNGSEFGVERFTSDGISSPQLIAVLAAIGLTIAVAARTRHLSVGTQLAVPIVRSAVIAVPLVLLGSLVFAYNDALARGIGDPSLADIAWPNVVATALGAGVFAAASRCEFAWAGLGTKNSGEIVGVLRLFAQLSLAAALLFTAGFGVTVGWLGTGLFGYSVALAVLERRYPSSRSVWLVPGAALLGAVLALGDPGPTTVTWGAIAGLVALRSTTPAVARVIARYLTTPERSGQRQLQLGLATLVAIGAGPARLAWPDGAPTVLLIAGAVLATTRLAGNKDIRSLAAVAAASVTAGGVAVEVYRQFSAIGLSAYPLSVFLGAAALVFLLTTVPVPARLTGSTLLTIAGASIALREYFGSDHLTATWVDTSVLAVFGLVLVVAAYKPRRGFASGMGHLLVVAAVARSLPYEETTILGLSALLAVAAFGAWRIERGHSGIFAGVEWVPALVALTTTVPVTILAARQTGFFSAQAPRFGPLLAGLAWAQLATAIPVRPRIRKIAVPLAYVVSIGAILAGTPSVTATLITTTAAAALTAVVAIASRRPLLTTVSWILVVAAALLAANRAGVDAESLHLVLHAASLSLVVIAAVSIRSVWARPAVVVGALLLPVATLMSDGGYTSWLALSAAGGYAWLGTRTRIGMFSLPTSAGIMLGYAAVLSDNAWADLTTAPLLWMPLAAGLVAASALLPGRRGWRIVIDPAPGLLLAGLALGGFALVATAAPEIALVCVALLLIESYVIRRDDAWLAGATVALVLAGLTAGSFWAPLATLLLAFVAGLVADRYRSDPIASPMRVLTATSVAATHGLTAIWLAWDGSEAIAATATVAGLLLAFAFVAEVKPSLPDRLRSWRIEAFWLSQLGAVVAIGIAEGQLSAAAAAGVAAGVVGTDAVLAGLVGTLRRSAAINVGAGFFAAAAYSQLPIWLDWTRDEYMAATALVALTMALVATMATRGGAESSLLNSWVAALHGLAGAASVAVLAEALLSTSGDPDFWVSAAVLFVVGAHLAVNAWAAPQEWQIRGLAVASALGGAVCAVLAADGPGAPLPAIALATAGLGLVVAMGAGSVANTDAVWRRELVGLFAGLEVVATCGLLQRYRILDTETGVVLIVAGAALAAYGVLARHLEVVEAALVTWLGAFLILGNDQIGMSLHVAAVTASAALLGVLELERVRYEIEDRAVPEWADPIEWILMLAPLTLAAAEMFGDLWFGLALFGEGFILTAWGTATQVRRRAFLGVTAMVLAIVLTAAIPAVHGLVVGLAAGTWLAIGAIAAVVFIAAGSAIERQRYAIGRHLARIGEIVNDWN